MRRIVITKDSSYYVEDPTRQRQVFMNKDYLPVIPVIYDTSYQFDKPGSNTAKRLISWRTTEAHANISQVYINADRITEFFYVDEIIGVDKKE